MRRAQQYRRAQLIVQKTAFYISGRGDYAARANTHIAAVFYAQSRRILIALNIFIKHHLNGIPVSLLRRRLFVYMKRGVAQLKGSAAGTAVPCVYGNIFRFRIGGRETAHICYFQPAVWLYALYHGTESVYMRAYQHRAALRRLFCKSAQVGQYPALCSAHNGY